MAAPGGRGQVEMRGQHRSLLCPKLIYETKTELRGETKTPETTRAMVEGMREGSVRISREWQQRRRRGRPVTAVERIQDYSCSRHGSDQ